MFIVVAATGCLCLSYLLSAKAQSLAMDSASEPAPVESLQFRSATGNSSSGLDGAASSGGYYYDKPRYKAEYGYGGYGPKYDSGDSYGGGYATQSCYGQTPGMFGNPSYDCKSFSICQSDGRLDIMDCPAYTRFNNYLMVCDWPYKTDSYCNPIYKDEYYSPSYGKSYEKPSYYEKPAYYEKPTYYEKPSYYEKPAYEKPSYSPPAYPVAPAYPVVPSYNSYAPKTYGYYVNQYEYPAAPSYGAGYKSSYSPSPYGGSSYYSKKY